MWKDYAKVFVDIASIASTPIGADAGYWQPDGHQTAWQADGALPGDPGYGVWVAGTAPVGGGDWDLISWFPVECDMTSVEFTTGFETFGNHSEPGSLTVNLYDQDMEYTPIGPPGGLDDIGIDTPIRIRVQFLSMFDTTPVSPMTKPDVVLWAGYIRRIVHNISIDGQHLTIINASEVIETYGRVNPVASTDLPDIFIDSLALRLDRIHQKTDKPADFPRGESSNRFNKDSSILPTTDLHDNLWQETCMAGDVYGGVTGSGMYPEEWVMIYAGYYGNTAPLGTPRVYVMDPYADSFNDIPGESFRTWVASVQVRPYCSDPDRTAFTVPCRSVTDNPSSLVPIAVAPTHMAINHALDGVANSIDLAIAGLDGSAQSFVDDASIARWGKHTYTRHDLQITHSTGTPSSGQGHLTKLGNRMLGRLGEAVYSLEGLTFPVDTARDLVTFVGYPTYRSNPTTNKRTTRNVLCRPGDWWSIHWEAPKLDAYLLICTVNHRIGPFSWECSISGELAQVNGSGPAGLPIPIPAHRDLELIGAD
jgi:hypothetical protein